MNVFFIFLPRGQGDNIIGNYIRVDTDFILKDNFRQFRHQLLSIQGRFCFCSNEMQQCRIWRAKQN